MKKLIVFLTFCISVFANDYKLEVLQPPSSTCPKSWFEDMKNVADEIKVITVMDVKSFKRQVGIPYEVQSCNTSLLNDFVFEGNVPSSAIKDFFKNTPKGAIGLALPSYENKKEEKTVYIIYEDKSYKEFGKY